MNTYHVLNAINSAQVKNLTKEAYKYISESIIRILFRDIKTMLLNGLTEKFGGISQDLGSKVRVAALALPLVFGGMAANDAIAQDNQVATAVPDAQKYNAVYGSDAMDDYSKDPEIQGIGVFINMQANAPVTGDQIGQWIQRQFASINSPVPVDYRVNQSRGTATDITFYTRGFPLKLNVGELETKLIDVLNHHRDVWLPETASAETSPSIIR